MVELTGLWLSPKGSLTGNMTPDKFSALFQLMKEAHAKGVGLFFVAAKAKEPKGSMAGRLYVAVSRPQQQPAQPAQPAATPFDVPSGSTSPVASGPFTSPNAPVNPPKDELDSLLESM